MRECAELCADKIVVAPLVICVLIYAMKSSIEMDHIMYNENFRAP